MYVIGMSLIVLGWVPLDGTFRKYNTDGWGFFIIIITFSAFEWLNTEYAIFTNLLKLQADRKKNLKMKLLRLMYLLVALQCFGYGPSGIWSHNSQRFVLQQDAGMFRNCMMENNVSPTEFLAKPFVKMVKWVFIMYRNVQYPFSQTQSLLHNIQDSNRLTQVLNEQFDVLNVEYQQSNRISTWMSMSNIASRMAQMNLRVEFNEAMIAWHSEHYMERLFTSCVIMATDFFELLIAQYDHLRNFEMKYYILYWKCYLDGAESKQLSFHFPLIQFLFPFAKLIRRFGFMTFPMCVVGLQFSSASADPEKKSRDAAKLERSFRVSPLVAIGVLATSVDFMDWEKFVFSRDSHDTLFDIFYRDYCFVLVFHCFIYMKFIAFNDLESCKDILWVLPVLIPLCFMAFAMYSSVESGIVVLDYMSGQNNTPSCFKTAFSKAMGTMYFDYKNSSSTFSYDLVKRIKEESLKPIERLDILKTHFDTSNALISLGLKTREPALKCPFMQNIPDDFMGYL